MNKPRKPIPVAHPVLDGNERAYVLDCIDSSWISSVGKYIGQFEERFAAFCGTSHAIACNNGTTALHLALLGLGAGEGDEVLVPTLTYIASANAVRYCNATPVLVDSEPLTWNIDPSLIERAITPRTKGIVVVHLYGHPADMDPIAAIARRHNLFILEDAAEAHGATYRGRPAGSLSHAATFSFYGNKIITTGEGGMITTADPALAERIRLLRGQGMDPSRRYWFPIVGYNYRMTNIAAAIGLAQLERIGHHLDKRAAIAALYDAALAPIDGAIVRPHVAAWARHSYWSYSILLRHGGAEERDAVMEALAADGIETRPVFIPLHAMPPYQPPFAGCRGPYPVAERIGASGISLPMHGLLETSDIEWIASRLTHHLSSACQPPSQR
ncbi:MAG: DegT/DnrJ/EryC1/StrS family aminotransferase [Bryobacteraceae bacterium]